MYKKDCGGNDVKCFLVIYGLQIDRSKNHQPSLLRRRKAWTRYKKIK